MLHCQSAARDALQAWPPRAPPLPRRPAPSRPSGAWPSGPPVPLWRLQPAGPPAGAGRAPGLGSRRRCSAWRRPSAPWTPFSRAPSSSTSEPGALGGGDGRRRSAMRHGAAAASRRPAMLCGQLPAPQMCRRCSWEVGTAWCRFVGTPACWSRPGSLPVLALHFPLPSPLDPAACPCFPPALQPRDAQGQRRGAGGQAGLWHRPTSAAGGWRGQPGCIAALDTWGPPPGWCSQFSFCSLAATHSLGASAQEEYGLACSCAPSLDLGLPCLTLCARSS